MIWESWPSNALNDPKRWFSFFFRHRTDFRSIRNYSLPRCIEIHVYLELPSPFKFCHFRSVTLFFLNRPLFWQTRHFDPNNQFPLIPMVFHPKPEPQDKMAQKCWKWPLCLKRPARAWLFFIFWHWESGMSGEKKQVPETPCWFAEHSRAQKQDCHIASVNFRYPWYNMHIA